MALSVTIDSVTLNGAMGVTVAGSGSPNGATVSVHVQINGGAQGNAGTIVNNSGGWTTPVMMPAAAGQTGTATATLTFQGQQSTPASKNFTL